MSNQRACGMPQDSAQLEQLINQVPGGIAIYRLEGGKIRTLLFSDGLADLTGRSRQEQLDWTGEDALAAVCLEDLPRMRSILHRAARGEEVLGGTCRVCHRDGRELWINFSGRKIREDDGCPVYNVVLTPAVQETQMYRRILDGSANGVIVCELATKRVLYTNRYLRDLIGLRGERLDEEPLYCYQTILDRTTPCTECIQERITADAFFRNVIQGGDGRFYQTENRRIDWNGIPAYIAYVSDITDRVQEERRVRARYAEEENKRHLLEKDVLTLCVFNVTRGTLSLCDFRIVRPDDLKLRSGMPMEQALEYLLGEIPREEDKALLRQQYDREKMLNRMRQGVTSNTLEYRRDNRRGELIWVSNEYNLVEEPESKDIICYTYVRSINEKKQYEQMLGTIVDLNYDFALIIDCRTGRARPISPDANLPEDSLIYARDPEQARADMMRRFCADDDVEDLILRTNMEAVTAALENQFTYSVAFGFWEKGELCYKEMTFAYLDDTRQQLCCVRHDITALHLAEQEKNRALSQALRQAREAGQAKDDFLSRMSHDIRTPLSGIIGLTNLALGETKEEETQKYLSQIESSGQYLLSLVNDILDMTKIASQKMELHLEVYPYREWLEMLQAVIGEPCRQKNIHFSARRDCPLVHAIFVDKLRFNQIFFNLLSNAVKFTPVGGEVSVVCFEKILDERHCRMRLSVTDNGCGIGPEFMPKAFDAFTQERTAATDDTPGTGLGLSIVKSLVELMGGTITLESTPGKGTCATVELTVLTVLEEDVPPAIEGPLPGLTGCHVLLAEDHPINATIACKLLERGGVTVDRVENGQQAVDRFAASAPGAYDAILLDIRMPVMDGLTAAKTIRALPRQDAGAIPILAMTANAFGDDVVKSREAGMNDHLAKPVEPQKLYQALARQIVLGRERAARSQH
ncbi:MAG: ATP-binding protein [Oscillibacter sp.]